MGAVGVTFPGVHGLLEQRPENFGADRGPVGDRGLAQRVQLDGGELERGHGVEQAAVEVGGALVAATAGGAGGVHLPEQPEEQVVGLGAGGGVLQGPGEEPGREQPDVLGEHCHHGLEHEGLGVFAVHAAVVQPGEDSGDLCGGVAGDRDQVVAEDRGGRLRQQERQGVPALGEFVEGDPVHRSVELLVKS